MAWRVKVPLLLLLLIISILVSLSIGDMNIPLLKIPSILIGEDSLELTIIRSIRIPRIILGIAVGGSLGLSGAILQGVYRNPLVEPYTLGVSGGAALGVALVIVTGLHITVGGFMLPLAGFIGSLITALIVYMLSINRGALDINKMLLMGVMISFVSSSSMMLLISITSSDNLQGIIFWMMGSLDEPNITLVYGTLIISIVGLLVSYIFARPLNAIRIGIVSARHLGIDTTLTIKILFIVTALLTGVSVSVAGMIGFVGLVIPHTIKMFVGSDYRVLLLSSFIGGALFLVVCDLIARRVILPNELPIGVITGVVGGIMFIIMLYRRSLTSKKNSNE